MQEPQQLTLWPDDAMPGQLPLFNRKAEVDVLSEKMSGYCRHCETLLADFLASHKTPPKRPLPSEPLHKPGERSVHHPTTEIIPAASAYL